VVNVSATLAEVRSAVSKVFRTNQAADAFLSLPCPALGGVPTQLVAQGRGDEVLAFVEKLAEIAPAPPSGLGGLFQGWLGPFAGRKR
jgi:hypothetical protein